MGYIIIKRGPYTWLLHIYWVYIFFFFGSFLLTQGFILILNTLARRLEKKKPTSKPMKSAHPDSESPFDVNRGGDFTLIPNMEKCFTEPGLYEVINENLKKAIRQVLNEHGKVLMVSVPVALFAFVIQHKPGQLLLRGGTTILFDQIRRSERLAIITAISAGVGTGVFVSKVPLLLLGMPVSILGQVLSSWTVSLIILALIRSIDCNNLVHRLPEINDKPYIEQIALRGDKVFIKTEPDEKLEFLVLQPSTEDECTHKIIREVDTTGINIKKNNEIGIIKTTCPSKVRKRNFVPLSKRTKTLRDLKVEPSLQNYEQIRETASQRYQTKREQIMENRNRNNNE